MRILKNSIVILLIGLLIILINCTQVWADPNSSKGFATLGDEESHQQTEELIKEQDNNVTEVKSSDNYLSSLSVEGYTLTPEFDKQTLSYTIKEEVKTKEIKIIAKANNEKATINGAGTIKIETEKNSYLVEVTAENGTVRTYTIKLKENITNNQEEKKVETTGKDQTQNDTQNIEQDSKDNQSNNFIIIGLSIFTILVFLWYCYKKINGNKRKKRRR